VAEFSSLSLKYRAYMAVYRWRRIDPVPWAELRRPLVSARVALVTSAGFYRSGIDEPFRRMTGGDSSFRALPDDVDPRSLVLGQMSDSFDHGPATADPNVAFPLEWLHQLAAAGEIGASAPRHLSFNGSITAPERMVRDTGPRAVELLLEDGVDAAVLVPI
jgi:D-proline reductase (dithiol) PrdB